MTPEDRSRIILASTVDITLHYRGPVLLAHELAARGWSVEIVAPIGSVDRTRQVALWARVHDIKGGTIGRFRLIRRVAAALLVFRLAIVADVVVSVEPGLGLVLALAKLLRRRKVLFVMSCGEMYEKAEGHSRIERASYYAAIRLADIILDVDRERLRHRTTGMGINSRPSLVIPNTLPKSTIAPSNLLRRSCPVLAYAGNLAGNSKMERLAESLSLVTVPFRLVMFVHGTSHEISKVTETFERALGANRVDVRSAIPVELLHKALVEEADIGLVHYPIDDCSLLGQYLCAPGKVFDYLRAGLTFVGTANPTLKTLAASTHSVCADFDSPLEYAKAVEKSVLGWASGDLPSRADVQELFDGAYSAETVCGTAADLVEGLLAS